MPRLAPPAASRKVLPGIEGNPTICVVDAHPGDYIPWVTAAADSGVRLEILSSADAALRRARQKPVDLWVVNAKLPGISGTELCRMLKAQTSHALVHVVADEYSPTLEQAAWASRASLFECKPLPASRIETWLAHWRSKHRRRVPPRQSSMPGVEHTVGRT